jgi:hypothetical protein
VRRLLAVTVGNDSPDDDPDVEVARLAGLLETARLNRWLGHRQWAPPEPSTRQQIRRAPGRRPA